MSGKGKSEGVKITVFKTCPCDYLTSPCKSRKYSSPFNIAYVCAHGHHAQTLDHFSSHGGAKSHLHLHCRNTAQRYFLYWVRTVAETTPCQDNFWDMFWLSGPKHPTVHCKNSFGHTILHIFCSKEMLLAEGVVTLLPHPGHSCASLPATCMLVWLLQALDLNPRFARSAL